MKNRKNRILEEKDSDLEFAIADVLSSQSSSGTKFTQDGEHGYQGRLWDYIQEGCEIRVVEPEDLDEKYKKINYLEIISAFVVSWYTDVANPSLAARSEEELRKAESRRPTIDKGSRIKITFSKSDYERGNSKPYRWDNTPYFLYSLGPDNPGNDTPNVISVEVLRR